jgi:hypothetical protein
MLKVFTSLIFQNCIQAILHTDAPALIYHSDFAIQFWWERSNSSSFLLCPFLVIPKNPISTQVILVAVKLVRVAIIQVFYYSSVVVGDLKTRKSTLALVVKWGSIFRSKLLDSLMLLSNILAPPFCQFFYPRVRSVPLIFCDWIVKVKCEKTF